MSDVPAAEGAHTSGGASSASHDRTKSAPTRSREQAATETAKKPNIFKRIAIFVTQVVDEMKKVIYPSKEELWAYFLVVIVFVAAIMAYTGLLDLLFGKLSTMIFG